MGFIHVPVTVRNPADASKEVEVNFLVDTGAMDSLVPRDRLEAIGIKPKGQREYILADGSEGTFDVSTADMEIMGEFVASRVIFGEPGTQPLLGALDLQAAAIVIDPSNETLHKMPSLRRL